MALGGVEFLLRAPARPDLADCIFRACERHWPEGECYFQDVLETKCYGFADQHVWDTGVKSKEFFIYQNQSAVSAWEEGPSPRNVNQMLHFTLGDPMEDEPALLEVSLVCDRSTPAIRSLIDDLNECFTAFMPSSMMKGAA